VGKDSMSSATVRYSNNGIVKIESDARINLPVLSTELEEGRFCETFGCCAFPPFLHKQNEKHFEHVD
jgi:hypothetical protein